MIIILINPSVAGNPEGFMLFLFLKATHDLKYELFILQLNPANRMHCKLT